MIIKKREKKERALGTKLFLKGDRSFSPKSAVTKRPYRPGQHGQSRHTLTEFAKELQEKQKVQLTYGLNNTQMRKLFKNLSRNDIIMALETRLDRVIYLLGFGVSPRIARQMVSHGHVMVNDKKVTIPSYRVKMGNVISIRPESRSLKIFEGLEEKIKKQNIPDWIKLNEKAVKAECVKKPDFTEARLPFDLNLVGQYYSR